MDELKESAYFIKELNTFDFRYEHEIQIFKLKQ